MIYVSNWSLFLQIRVTLRNDDRRAIEVTAEPLDVIEDLKKKIEAAVGIPSYCQHLSMEGVLS